MISRKIMYIYINKIKKIEGKIFLGGVYVPNCSTCPIFYECPINVPGDAKGKPNVDCPLLKMIELQ